MSTSSGKFAFGAGMSCGGCSGAIERTLGRVPGAFEVVRDPHRHGAGLKTTTDLKTQRVDVEVEESARSSVTYDDVLARIRKTGKPVHWGDDGSGSGPVAYTDEGKTQLAATQA